MYNIKVLYKDKVEPTTKIDTDDIKVVSDKLSEVLDEVSNPDSDVIGVYICNKSKR